jgi:hypothetical protein
MLRRTMAPQKGRETLMVKALRGRVDGRDPGFESSEEGEERDSVARMRIVTHQLFVNKYAGPRAAPVY